MNPIGRVANKLVYYYYIIIKLDRIRNERIIGTTKVGEISKKVKESRLIIENTRRIHGQESDGD